MIKIKEKGITLIALVITIVILIILSMVTISVLTGNGLISRANEAAFKNKMAAYKEQTNMYLSWKISQTLETNTSNINSGEILKNAIDQEIITDITKEDVSIDIKEIIKDIKNSEKEYIVVYKGELCYVSSEEVSNNEKQVQWCNEIGIRVLEYKAPEGIVVKNGKYEAVNGLYLCTPQLDKGFVQNRTRYLEVSTTSNVEYLTPGNWVNDNPTTNWYNYQNGNWANIYVEYEGEEIYYVWIPRYCFALDQDKQRSDVRFIDTDNNYKEIDENGNVTTYTIEQLNAKEGKTYQIPEAFTFGGKDLAGYWAMKYTVGEVTTPTLSFDMSVSKGKLSVKNIKLNTSVTNSNPIVKYTLAINGNVVKTIDDSSEVENITSKVLTSTSIKAGNNTINLTGLNAQGEIVGSYTSEYVPAVVNRPDLAPFNQETTFYVTYDENGNEHSTIPISQDFPEYWYDYGASEWANIVTRNNGLETYYVWIPRYEFSLNQSTQRSTVRFIQGTTTQASSSAYQIPEAFTFGGKQLRGFWAMKYTVGEEFAPQFDTEVVATSSSIKTKGIIGTAVESGQKYNYYIDGEFKGSKTTANDTFEFSGLEQNTDYTILVEIRTNNSADEYIGTIVKQISTIDANKPELGGFNTIELDSSGNKLPVTYYVLYDQNGNETIGPKVKNDGSNMPSNWYNYSESRWANIVVTNGTIENGQIKDATMTTYYTWIPRYEFMIPSSQQKQPLSGRIEVRFLREKETEADIGYQIPEAFTFGGKQLTGYWATKYTIGE